MKYTLIRKNENIEELDTKWDVKVIDYKGELLSNFLKESLTKVMEGILDPDISGKKPDRFINNLFNGRLGDFSKRYIISTYSENEVAGLLIGLPKDDRLHIFSMGVTPKYRNLGIGTHLLNKCFYDMQDLYSEISLDVHENNYPAIKLYKKLGFIYSEKDKFIKGLINKDLDILKQVDKSDLHNHATRGGNVKYIENYYNKKIKRLDYKFNNLNQMQDWYNENIKPICVGKEGYEIRIKSALLQAKADGVKLLSMSFGVGDSVFYNSIEEWIDTLKQMHKLYAPKVKFIPEIAFSRGIPVDKAVDIFNELIIHNFFKSIDLQGIEDSVPVSTYKPLYNLAKNNDFILRAHVGEFGSAESILKACKELDLDEIHHGIRAAESKEVMDYLKANNIKLHICPTSNVLLDVVDNYENHPIRKLYDYGVIVTINTDDLLIFNQSVSEEYLNLYKAGLLSASELNKIRENGLYL